MPGTTLVEHHNTRYRVRVSAGPDRQQLRPLTVNDDANPLLIDTDEFIGNIVFRIKGQDKIIGYEEGQQQDELKVMPDSKWFQKAGEAGRGDSHLMSMEVVGRFKRDWSGEQVDFACVFDGPLQLPPLTSLAVKFFKAIDPGLQLDVQCDKPYFISPLLAAMNTVNVSHDPVNTASTPSSSEAKGQLLPPWPSSEGEHLVEDTSLVVQEEDTKKKNKVTKDPGARRGHFAKSKNLSKHRYVRDHVYGFELYNPILDCSRFSVKLPGLCFDLFKILNEQPITYVVRTKDESVSFFAVAIQLVPLNDLSDV
ncbi:hypothetical protein EDD21DRAFT_377496 [Dissophora ornata]|nr:hypothetical protein EDD21DRAFT_377496 [Dissophora ornata]